MSFLKITDPIKREFIVEEFLKTKKNIQQSFLSEKLGDTGLQHELTKLYKPVTDAQKGLQESIKRDLGSIKENLSATLQALPAPSSKAIQFPQYPSIEAFADPVEDIRTLELGNLATKYLQQYASNKKSTDTTFGINSKDGAFYIGDTPVTIQDNDIIVHDKMYAGTHGLWELLTMTKPDKSIYDANDMGNYAEILNTTNAIRQPNNPSKPKSNRSEKYKQIIKPIWELNQIQPRTNKTGRGILVIPQDPNALTDMLSLRMSSFKAGNTGVRNEIISICDELLRQGVINKDDYKSIMLCLN